MPDSVNPVLLGSSLCGEHPDPLPQGRKSTSRAYQAVGTMRINQEEGMHGGVGHLMFLCPKTQKKACKLWVEIPEMPLQLWMLTPYKGTRAASASSTQKLLLLQSWGS